MEVKWVKSSKRKSVPIISGQLMRVKSCVKDRKYWRCVVTECEVTACSEGENIIYVRKEHNHPIDEVQAVKIRAVEIMKDRVVSKPLDSISKIHQEVRSELIASAEGTDQEDLVREGVPSLYQAKSSLHRCRRLSHPSNPATRADLNLFGQWSRTISDQNFLLFDDGSADRILIFGTDKMMSRICAAKRISMDGTFKTAPALFYQLYSLHCQVEGKIVPQLFILLPDKKRETYDRMFDAIINIASNRDLLFNPSEFMVDFEQAMLVSIEGKFPQACVKGCFFHYAQSIWRQVQTRGYVEVFNKNIEFQHSVRRMLALAMAPENLLDELWLYIESKAPRIPEYRDMADYFVDTWLNEESSRFKRQIWNHGDNTNARTNNDAEGTHQKWNSILKTPHPNIYAFIDFLKTEEKNLEIEIDSMIRLHPIRPTSKKYRLLEEKRNKLRIQLENGTKTPQEFLEKMKFGFKMA